MHVNNVDRYHALDLLFLLNRKTCECLLSLFYNNIFFIFYLNVSIKTIGITEIYFFKYMYMYDFQILRFIQLV